MVKKFNAYIKKHKLFNPASNLLVAVSGGADSIGLCHLLLENKNTFSVAHCNFKLRGKEADGDENFVVQFCKKNNIPCFTTNFNTAEYAKNKGISIQMAARELRYNWFNELLTQHNFDYLLTAHHANDNVETFFINLLRGSGLNGLKGILPKKDKIVRPLLFATRKQIEEYINKNKISFREDSSNSDDKYLRNYLRLHVVPQLKKLNPSFEQTLNVEMEVLQQANVLVTKEVEKQRKKLLVTDKNNVKIDIKKLQKTTTPQLFLFEIIKQFGFNTSQVTDVLDALESQSGKEFTSPTHTLIKDRYFLFIKENIVEISTAFSLKKTTKHIDNPVKMKIAFLDGNIKSISKKQFKNSIALLDADKLTWPLTLNKWQEGDTFKPLGMSGTKKLSDFFISQKTNRFDKQNQWILRSKKNIVWLVGKRIDDRYKVTEVTKKICMIEVFD